MNAHPIQSHLTVCGRPYCGYLGTIAGNEIAEETGVYHCSFPSRRAATTAKRALQKRLYDVRVVDGPCPDDGSAA